jgi:hypothetical protein
VKGRGERQSDGASERPKDLTVAAASRRATEEHMAAEEERDAAQAQVRELSLRVHELEETGHAAGAAIVEELEAVKGQLVAADERKSKVGDV